MTFLEFVRKEFKVLFSERFTRLAVIVVCGLPLLYSFLYLYAFWDPYGKLDKLPVAFVNQDEGTVYKGTPYNFGSELEDKLKDNNNMKWEFVSASEAQYGLDHKKYYIALKVPQDFSKKVMSVDSSSPEQAKLDLISNQGSNYLASQIGDRVITELKTQLSGEISQKYLENIFGQVRTVAQGFNSAGDGAAKLSNGIDQTISGNKKLSQGLSTAYYANAKVANGNKEMSQGANELYNGLERSYQATDLMSQKTQDAKQGLDKINSGLSKLHSGSDTLNGKLKEAAKGEGQIKEGLVNATSGAKQLSEGTSQLSDGLKQTSSGIGQVNDGLKKMNESVTSGTNKLISANQALVSGTQNLSLALTQYNNAQDKIESGIGQNKTAAQNAEASLNDYLANHPEAKNDPNLAKAMGLLKNVNSDSGLDGVLNGVKSSNKSLKEQIIPAAGKIASSQQQVGSGISELKEQSSEALVGGPSNQNAILPALTFIKNSIDSKLVPGSEQLAYESGKLAAGTNTLTQGSGELQDGLNIASSKVNELGQGTAKLEQGTKTLSGGMELLYNNLCLLNEGQGKLSSGSLALKNGLNQSTSGLTAINNGLSGINNGQKQLGSGLTKLKSGADRLASNLKGAAKQASSESNGTLTDKTSLITNPINLEDNSIHKVSRYGVGFAPYFIPLSLWVGAIMIFFVVEANNKFQFSGKHMGLKYGLSKYCTVAAISAIQAIITSFVIRNVLHLSVTNSLSFYLFNILMSLVFVAIIQFLVNSFGIAGRFIALVLLMLQLTSAGGTFPIELVPRFFQVLNPLLPMSYGVNGLRMIITGANSSLIYGNIAALVIFGIVFFGLTIFSYISPLFAKLKVPDHVTA